VGLRACLNILRKCKLLGLRRRWVDNIKMDLQEVGYGDMDWIDLALDRWRTIVNTVMNVRDPYNVENFLTS